MGSVAEQSAGVSAKTKRPDAVSRHRKPIADSVADELGRRVEIKLSHDGRTVRLDRLDADAESVCDLLIALAFGNQSNDSSLSIRQSCSRCSRVVGRGCRSGYGRLPTGCAVKRLRSTYRSLDPVALLAEIRRCQDELGERIAKRGLAAAANAGPGRPARLGTRARNECKHWRGSRDAPTCEVQVQDAHAHALEAGPASGHIEDWLATEPQITALTILRRLTAINPDAFGDKQHSIVQRLLKALRRKAAQPSDRRDHSRRGPGKNAQSGCWRP